MKIVIQRVSRATVRIDGVEQAGIGEGLLLLVGVEREDGAAQADKAADKIVNLRVFSARPGLDERMERSVLDISGEILVVSQFTLAGSLRKGRRPGFDAAAPPGEAEPIYDRLIVLLCHKRATLLWLASRTRCTAGAAGGHVIAFETSL